MPVLLKVGIGMVVGPFIPLAFYYIPGSLFELRMILLFGPVFGGSMAYFLHRFRHVEQTAGSFAWTLLSGALAGGATAGMAYDLGYLTSPWHLLAGVGLGALLIILVWILGELEA